MKRFLKILLPTLLLAGTLSPFIGGVAGAAEALGLSGPASGNAGAGISASAISAILSGGSGSSFSRFDGTITFYEEESSTAPTSGCGGSGWTAFGTATAVGNNTYNPSAGFTPSTAGNYWLYADYPRDAHSNGPLTSPCSSSAPEIVVGKASTTLSLAVSPGTGTVGSAIAGSVLTATVAVGASPTGTITFYESGPSTTAPGTCPGSMTSIGTATVSANGAYHSSAGFTPAATGDYWIYASYGGDTNHAAAVSPCAPTSSQEIIVGKGTSVITVTSTAPGSATVGGATYTPSATATSGDTVAITSGTTSVCTISSGVVSFVATGTCTLDFNDTGNANYNAASQVTQSFSVGKGTSIITVTSTAPGSAAVGGATYTPTATATSGDTVAITSGTTSVCTISSGVVHFVATGTCTLDFNDTGNANYNAASQVRPGFSLVGGKSVSTVTS